MATKRFWKPITMRELEECFHVFLEHASIKNGYHTFNVVERLPGKEPYFVALECKSHTGAFQRACNFVRKHRLQPGMHLGYQSVDKAHYGPKEGVS